MNFYFRGAYYSFTQTQVAIAALVVVLAIIIAIAAFQQRGTTRTTSFRTRFGTEYDRALLAHGSRQEAEDMLAGRESRVQSLEIRDLNSDERNHFNEDWKVPASPSLRQTTSSTPCLKAAATPTPTSNSAPPTFPSPILTSWKTTASPIQSPSALATLKPPLRNSAPPSFSIEASSTNSCRPPGLPLNSPRPDPVRPPIGPGVAAAQARPRSMQEPQPSPRPTRPGVPAGQ